MATTHSQRSTIVGVFEDRNSADQAVADLVRAGFNHDQIGIAMRNSEGTAQVSNLMPTSDEDTDKDSSQAGSGAIAGALTGLGLGALAGLGVLAGVIPVVGPAIAAGTLGVILSNAAAGAGIAGLVGALIGAGIPEEEAEYYHQEFEAGRIIVTVNADGRAEEAMGILRRHGAYDVHDRGASRAADIQNRGIDPSTRISNQHGSFRGESKGSNLGAGTPFESEHPTGHHTTREAVLGSTGGTDTRSAGSDTSLATGAATGSAAGYGAGPVASRHDEPGTHTFQAREERLLAQKTPVEAGEVSVRKEVRTENRTIEVPVEREEVVIERTPGHGQPTTMNPADLREGEAIRIPVREEQVDLTKEAVVMEEVKVGKRTVQDTETHTGQVRKEEIKVEKTGDAPIRTEGPGKGETRSR